MVKFTCIIYEERLSDKGWLQAQGQSDCYLSLVCKYGDIPEYIRGSTCSSTVCVASKAANGASITRFYSDLVSSFHVCVASSTNYNCTQSLVPVCSTSVTSLPNYGSVLSSKSSVKSSFKIKPDNAKTHN